MLQKQPTLIENHHSILKTADTLTDGNEDNVVKTSSSVPASSLCNTSESTISSPLHDSCLPPDNSKDEIPLYQNDWKIKESKPWSAFVTHDDDDGDDVDNYVAVTAVKVFVDPELEEKDIAAPEHSNQIAEDSVPVKEEEMPSLHDIDAFKGNKSLHEVQAQLSLKDQQQHSGRSKIYHLSNDIKKERFPVHLDSIPEEPKQGIRVLTDEAMGNAVVVTAVKVNIDPEMEDEVDTSPDNSLLSDEHDGGPSSLTALSEVSPESQKDKSSNDETDKLPGLSFLLPHSHHELPAENFATGNTEYNSEQLHGNKNTTQKYLQNYDPELLLNPDSRKHKMYPLSLSPIPEDFFEDDSSIEDDLPETLTKKMTDDEKQSPNKPMSVLELLQSVSEHLKLCTLAIEKIDYSQEKHTLDPLVSPDDLPQQTGISQDHQPRTSLHDYHTVSPSEGQLDLFPKEGPSADQRHFSDAWDTQQDQMSSHSTEDKEIKTSSEALPFSHVIPSNDTSVQLISGLQNDYSQHHTVDKEQVPQDISQKIPPKDILQPQLKGTQSVLYRYLHTANYLDSNESKKNFGLDKDSLPTASEGELDWLMQSKGTLKEWKQPFRAINYHICNIPWFKTDKKTKEETTSTCGLSHS